MATKKKSGGKKAGGKKKAGAGEFDWAPNSYDIAREHVALARNRTGSIGEVLAGVMPQAVRTMGAVNGLGGLSCPAPENDRQRRYRVGLDADGRPEIQRENDEGDWAPVG